MRLVRHVACRGDTRKACRILVRKLYEKGPKYKGKDNISFLDDGIKNTTFYAMFALFYCGA
jgi:hypothetical protein